jgi:siroheme synthase
MSRQANTSKQCVVKGTVETICDVTKGKKMSPAVIIIGKVVGLAVPP